VLIFSSSSSFGDTFCGILQIAAEGTASLIVHLSKRQSQEIGIPACTKLAGILIGYQGDLAFICDVEGCSVL
jgi:hypothetical protein